MNFIIRLLITAAVAWGLSSLLSGVHVADFKTALIFAVVLAVLNAIVKPILALLTLPITLITLGLWLFVLNAIIILIADRFIDGIKIDGIKNKFYLKYFLRACIDLIHRNPIIK